MSPNRPISEFLSELDDMVDILHRIEVRHRKSHPEIAARARVRGELINELRDDLRRVAKGTVE